MFGLDCVQYSWEGIVPTAQILSAEKGLIWTKIGNTDFSMRVVSISTWKFPYHKIMSGRSVVKALDAELYRQSYIAKRRSKL